MYGFWCWADFVPYSTQGIGSWLMMDGHGCLITVGDGRHFINGRWIMISITAGFGYPVMNGSGLGFMEKSWRLLWMGSVGTRYKCLRQFWEAYDSHNDHWMFVRDRDIDRTEINHYYINRTDQDRVVRYSSVINNTYVDNRRHTTYVTVRPKQIFKRCRVDRSNL